MSFITTTEAAWQGPSEIIDGTWGPNNDQFGIKYGDTNDVFAGPIYILADGQIVIQDVINARYKVYGADGTLKKALKCVEVSPDVHNDECNFDGDYLQTTTDGMIWSDQSKYKQPKYTLYASTGQLIKTSAERPLELGVAKEQALGSNQYKTTVTYTDNVYVFVSDKEYDRFVRDSSKNIYAILPGLVDKFNLCGKRMDRIILPEDIVFRETPPPTNREQEVLIHDQYGEPVVDTHGNVYTWKKSPTKYSILKWTWVDDPNAQTGPDAPTELKVMPSTTGIYLTWTESPNDPGCVTKYEISRATSAGGVTTTVATVNAGTLKYNDTTAETGTTYYYKVRAKAGSEYSPFTAEVSGKR